MKLRAISTCKEIAEEVDALQRAGWTLETGGRHAKIKRPDGQRFVSIPSSPGGNPRRILQNFKALVRRAQQ